MTAKTLMGKEEISAAIKKISREIASNNKDLKDIVLIGIQNRGVPIAERIAKNLLAMEKVEVPIGELDVSLHRDDILKKGSGIEVRKSDIPFPIDGKVVILVDDVISAGRTIRAAMDGLNDYGRPSKIQLVALIDRDQRELPIYPDYTGEEIKTAASDEVMVNLIEIDGVDKVVIK